MTDRLTAAVEELVEAIVEAIRSGVAAPGDRPPDRLPDRLLSVREAADALGIGRTAAYELIRRDELRSISIGRRRLVPSSAITEFIARGGR